MRQNKLLSVGSGCGDAARGITFLLQRRRAALWCCLGVPAAAVCWLASACMQWAALQQSICVSLALMLCTLHVSEISIRESHDDMYSLRRAYWGDGFIGKHQLTQHFAMPDMDADRGETPDGPT